MMENVPALFYNQISNKTFEVIGFIKDYLSDNYMGNYRKMKESNLCSHERIMIICEGNKLKMTESDYIYNGYIMNSSDRVILADIEKDSKIFYGSFLYVPDPKSSDFSYINSFILNKRIIDNINLKTDEGTIILLNLAYTIAKRYFLSSKRTEDSVINKLCKRSNLVIDNKIPVYENVTSDVTIYIDYLISMIMILDTMFNLKFGDVQNVKQAIKLNSNTQNQIITKCFEEIYNYAIDVNPDPEDYMNIYKKLFSKVDNN